MQMLDDEKLTIVNIVRRFIAKFYLGVKKLGVRSTDVHNKMSKMLMSC